MDRSAQVWEKQQILQLDKWQLRIKVTFAGPGEGSKFLKSYHSELLWRWVGTKLASGTDWGNKSLAWDKLGHPNFGYVNKRWTHMQAFEAWCPNQTLPCMFLSKLARNQGKMVKPAFITVPGHAHDAHNTVLWKNMADQRIDGKQIKDTLVL